MAEPSEATSRNAATLDDFASFCHEHPQMRFWQALSAWSGYAVLVADSAELECEGEGAVYDWGDPFYWEGKTRG